MLAGLLHPFISLIIIIVTFLTVVNKSGIYQRLSGFYVRPLRYRLLGSMGNKQYSVLMITLHYLGDGKQASDIPAE